LFIILLLFLLALLATLVLRRRKTDESKMLEQASFFMQIQLARVEPVCRLEIMSSSYKKFGQAYKAIELNHSSLPIFPEVEKYGRIRNDFSPILRQIKVYEYSIYTREATKILW
jgi:hypothetical protein